MTKFSKLLAGAVMAATLAGCQTTQIKIESFKEDTFGSQRMENYLDFKKGEMDGYKEVLSSPTGLQAGEVSEDIISNLTNVMNSAEPTLIDSPFSFKERQKVLVIPSSSDEDSYHDLALNALKNTLPDGYKVEGLDISGSDPAFERLVNQDERRGVMVNSGAHVAPEAYSFTITTNEGETSEISVSSMYIPKGEKEDLGNIVKGSLNKVNPEAAKDFSWRMDSKVRSLLSATGVDVGKVNMVSKADGDKLSKMTVFLHELGHTMPQESITNKSGEVGVRDIYKATSKDREASPELDTTLSKMKNGEIVPPKDKADALLSSLNLQGNPAIVVDESVADGFALMRLGASLTDNEWEFVKADLLAKRAVEPAIVPVITDLGASLPHDMVAHHTLPLVVPLINAIDRQRDDPNPRFKEVMTDSAKAMFFLINTVDMAHELNGKTMGDAGKMGIDWYETSSSMQDEYNAILNTPDGLDSILDKVERAMPEGMKSEATQELASDLEDDGLSFESIISNDGVIPDLQDEVMGIQGVEGDIFTSSLENAMGKDNTSEQDPSSKIKNKLKF